MKRTEIIKNLLSEGFTSKLLATFSDKQLNSLNERLQVSSKNPAFKEISDKIKATGDDVEVIESNEEDCNCGKKKSKENEIKEISGDCHECDKNELKEWVEKLVEGKYNKFVTTKSEITEIVKRKLMEVETMSPMPLSRPKKGHNGIPTFMSVDSIVAAAEPTTKPTTKPKVDPGVKPRTPFRPNPAQNPGPNAKKR